MLFSALVIQKLNLTKTDFADAQNLQNDETLAVISRMNGEQKRVVCAFLGCLMAVDGNIDNTEQALLNLMTSLCGLPIMSVEEALETMKNF